MPQISFAFTPDQSADALRLGTTALRSAGQTLDMQWTMARALMKTQARAAASLGLPDWSPLLDATGEQARRLASESAEHWITQAERAAQAAGEWQRLWREAFDTQSEQAREAWRRGLEEWQQQAGRGLQQWVELSRSSAEEAARASQALATQARDAVARGAEQWQGLVQQGQASAQDALQRAANDSGQAASQGADAISEALQQAAASAPVTIPSADLSPIGAAIGATGEAAVSAIPKAEEPKIVVEPRLRKSVS